MPATRFAKSAKLGRTLFSCFLTATFFRTTRRDALSFITQNSPAAAFTSRRAIRPESRRLTSSPTARDASAPPSSCWLPPSFEICRRSSFTFGNGLTKISCRLAPREPGPAGRAYPQHRGVSSGSTKPRLLSRSDIRPRRAPPVRHSATNTPRSRSSRSPAGPARSRPR